MNRLIRLSLIIAMFGSWELGPGYNQPFSFSQISIHKQS
jgi:hypothetical protein